jgi:hypothetical protein
MLLTQTYVRCYYIIKHVFGIQYLILIGNHTGEKDYNKN